MRRLTVKRFIPVAAPALGGKERTYVLDCLDSTWISSSGKYIEQFEEGFATFCGVRHALSCTNGTAALHLALMAIGIGPGDEVIVPTLTYVATANAVTYCGARPIFVDSEPETWNLNPTLIEEKITPRTKAIVVVHLYGHPVDMDPVLKAGRRHGLFIIEDAAEAHGAEYKGRLAGSLGDIAIFSFYGNKILTTGEGGMVVTNSENLAQKVRRLKGQGMDPERRYWFPIVGYNYRMTNIQAALGLAQLEKVEWHLKRRREIAMWYYKYFRDARGLILPVEKKWAQNVYWLFCVILDENVLMERDEIMRLLMEQGIETRPFFYPMHSLPPFQAIAEGCFFPVADRLASRGISLPTWSGLTEKEVAYICKTLLSRIT